MKITISGRAGSGKSTVAKIITKQLGLAHYSTGDLMRELAAERRMSLLELSREAEKNQSIDEEIDRRTEKFGKTKEDFIIDSRLAFHFIPDSIKIFLDVELKEAARRIFHDFRPNEKENASQEETAKNIQKRESSEKQRYKQYYNLDPYNKKNYDLVIDTTRISPKEVADTIINFVKKRGHKL